MGKMSLGLDDRSARLLHGPDVWTEIKQLLAGYNDVQAAIAFVGADADQYLQLRGPATIVVNAGDEALRNGWTDPSVLLRWTRRGVRVHSMASLHAKVLIAQGFPSFVLVGSADVLSGSGRAVQDAVLLADEKETVDEVRAAVARWRRLSGEPLTDAWLQEASARYRPTPPTRAAPVPVAATGSGPAVAEGIDDGAPAPAAEPTPAPDADSAPAPQPALEPVAEPDPEPAGFLPAENLPVAAAAAAAPAVTAAPAIAGSAVGAGSAAGEGPHPAEEPEEEAAVPVDLQPEIEPPAQPATGTDESPADRQPEAGPEHTPPTGPALPAATVEVRWPRPKFIYLATLTRDGRASESAQDKLDQLRADHRVPAGSTDTPILEVEMFWWDAPARSSGRPSAVYREGWHVVPIAVPSLGRPAVLSPVHSPGQVLHSFTEYVGGPARTYYYLLTHTAGAVTTLRKLREALTAVGEKPSYDHAYMMQHKVAAILDLWPEIGYSD